MSAHGSILTRTVRRGRTLFPAVARCVYMFLYLEMDLHSDLYLDVRRVGVELLVGVRRVAGVEDQLVAVVYHIILWPFR